MKRYRGIELKPCPFCGQANLYVSQGTMTVATSYHVWCCNLECRAIGPEALGQTAAVRAWNERSKEKGADDN
jgi:Lar family restriction alleviation protein